MRMLWIGMAQINTTVGDFAGNTQKILERIISRRGEIKAEARVTDTSSPGVVSIAFHFSESPTNVLTNSALDPVAKTPEMKVCTVRIVPQTQYHFSTSVEAEQMVNIVPDTVKAKSCSFVGRALTITKVGVPSG
jgi:predicted molibdopterin-dependent oxidoreductase YjgC